jgi:hypothetical protein
MTQRPSPFTIRPKKILIPLLISLSVLGVLAVTIVFSYHPVMVWLNHGKWCADVNAQAKVLAVHYGAECD